MCQSVGELDRMMLGQIHCRLYRALLREVHSLKDVLQERSFTIRTDKLEMVGWGGEENKETKEKRHRGSDDKKVQPEPRITAVGVSSHAVQNITSGFT